jgi:hypothetical protein
MNNRWEPITLTERNLPNDAIPFVMSKNDRDTVAMCRLELEAMRRFRMPEGVEVKEISMAEFTEAREIFARSL